MIRKINAQIVLKIKNSTTNKVLKKFSESSLLWHYTTNNMYTNTAVVDLNIFVGENPFENSRSYNSDGKKKSAVETEDYIRYT